MNSKFLYIATIAISFGIGFVADPAQLGVATAVPPLPDQPCSAAKDPATDSCDKP